MPPIISRVQRSVRNRLASRRTQLDSRRRAVHVIENAYSEWKYHAHAAQAA